MFSSCFLLVLFLFSTCFLLVFSTRSLHVYLLLHVTASLAGLPAAGWTDLSLSGDGALYSVLY